jgi:hypothetical protein
MNVQPIIQSQYNATLQMIGEAIAECSDALWDDPAYKNRFWRLAYHALFYTHLYLQPTIQDFVPWTKGRQDHEFLGPVPWPPHNEPDIGEPYTKEDLLEYVDLCRQEVKEKVPALDLEAPSGFEWLPFTKLELQFYNIRHLQLHAGQLVDRLRNVQAVGIDWVVSVPEDN